MTSESPVLAYVWIWLPESADPVVAGRLDKRADRYVFAYGRSYLDRPNAVAIYGPELPLDNFEHDSLDGPMPLASTTHLPTRGDAPSSTQSWEYWAQTLTPSHTCSSQVRTESERSTSKRAQPSTCHDPQFTLLSSNSFERPTASRPANRSTLISPRLS